jgi:O-antigen ligase
MNLPRISGLPAGSVTHAIVLGALLGAVVVFDPFATAYLLRDFDELRYFPFLLTLLAALGLCTWYCTRAFKPDLPAEVVHGYYMVFPPLFLLAYQLNGVALGPLDLTEVVIAIFVALFMAGLFIRRDQFFVASPFNMLHVALMVCIFLSLASQLKPFSFLKSFKPIVVFFLMVNFLPREELLRTFLRWLLIFAALSGVFCIVQELAWLAYQLPLTLIEKEKLKRMFEDTPYGPMFRVPGLMVSYRSMALYQATALLLAVSELLWRNQGRPPLLPRGWLYLTVLLSASAIGLTVAKDIYIGVGVALLLLLVLYRPNFFVPAFAVAALAGALGLATVTAIVPGTVDTVVDLTRTIPKVEQERIRLNRDSIQGVLHSPYTWTGRGIGAGDRYTAHHLKWPAHNAFILVAAELGVLGLAVLLLIYALAFARVVALCILVRSGPYLSIPRALLAMLVVIFAGAQFEADFLNIYIWTIFAVIEAVWFLLRHQSPENAGPTGVEGVATRPA